MTRDQILYKETLEIPFRIGEVREGRMRELAVFSMGSDSARYPGTHVPAISEMSSKVGA